MYIPMTFNKLRKRRAQLSKLAYIKPICPRLLENITPCLNRANFILKYECFGQG